MKKDLLLHFLKIKNELKNKIEDLKQKNKIFLENYWNNFLPNKKEFDVVAIDGSYNYLKYRSLIFYVINISSVTYQKKQITKRSFPYFDVIENFIFFEDFLRTEMLKRELKLASENMENFNIMLDGSLISFLNYVPEDIRKIFLEKVEITENLVFSISKTPIKSFSETNSEGFSKIISEDKKYNIVSFYFKLRKNSLIFRVETFKKFEERIEDIISLIRFFDFRGYPYLLKRAHEEAKISNKDMRNFVKLLGIREKTGREIL
ncbi:MAG: DNA double-strand break repair nuclease NurA [Candidatus Aenigmatarchaeota archaeon]